MFDLMVSILSIAVQLAFGWLLADFISGVLHWLEDRFGPGREHWPVLGPLIFAPNQLHHSDPKAFLASDFFERNWTTWLVATLVAIVLAWIFGSSLWLFTAWIGGMAVNEIHAWSHNKRLAPGWARWLQRLGIFQSPGHHAVHHAPPHKRGYCVLTDFLNPWLDGVHFWQLIEKPIPESWFRSSEERGE